MLAAPKQRIWVQFAQVTRHPVSGQERSECLEMDLTGSSATKVPRDAWLNAPDPHMLQIGALDVQLHADWDNVL